MSGRADASPGNPVAAASASVTTWISTPQHLEGLSGIAASEMGTRGGVSPAKRIAGLPPPAEAAAAADERGNVLVEQFRRELLTALQPALEGSASQLITKQEAACYGTVAEKVVQIGGRLERLAEEQMSLGAKMELLLELGDKLYLAQEYRAAPMFFYKRVFQLIGIQPGQQIDSDTSHPILTTSKGGQVYVRCVFGVAVCSIQTEHRSDPYLHHAGTLERVLSALKLLQHGMGIAVRLEKKHNGQFAWLILNGSLAVFSAAKPLVTLGFQDKVVGFLKWCLVALESTVVLSTINYILWRLQLCAAICECYQAMATKEPTRREQHAQSTLSCAEHALSIVHRLRKEEELDLPLPIGVQQILDRAQATALMLVEHAKSGTSREILSKATLEAAFTKPADQVRAAMNAMENLTITEKLTHKSRLYLAPFAQEHEAPMRELLSVVIDVVRPLFEEFSSQSVQDTLTTVSATDSSSETSLLAVFPLAFHLTTVRYCYCLGESCAQELKLLLNSIRTRIGSTPHEVPEENAAAVLWLVSIFEALDGMRQSLQMTQHDAEIEGTTTRQASPIELATGKVLPSDECLKVLLSTLRSCVLSVNGDFCLRNRDLLIAVALQLWRDVASPLLEVLEMSNARELPASLVQLLLEALEVIHLVFTTADFDDVLLHGHVALSFGSLLLGKKSPRLAAGVVQRVLERINDYRDVLALHRSFTSGAVDQAGAGFHTRSLSDATLSFDMFSAPCETGKTSNQPIKNDDKERSDDVGVPGTGAQFGRLHQDLCCVQVDLLLLLYRAELQDGAVTNALPPLAMSGEHSKNDNDGPSKHLIETELRLVSHCRQNGYMKALLSIQRLCHSSTTAEERIQLADECLKSLRRVEARERDLRQRASKRLTPVGSEPGCQLTTVSVAPIVIARSSSAVTIQIVEFLPALPTQRKRSLQFYMVYAKLAGAGTAVSLNNNQLPGTAVPIYPGNIMTATISGLAPNESYVFAVAAYDDQCELIHGIGETSKPVTALNPLPLPLCYGYLAQVCHELQIAEYAKKAANYLYDLVISSECARRPIWRASPFYRQAMRRVIVSRLPIPILDKCVAAMEILCRDQVGDPELDGLLITRGPEERSLLSTHVAVLESARRISIGVEIASAAGNQAAVNQLCFKGYRVLLPLLHLANGYGGMAYPALMTFFQGLATVERDPWHPSTHNLKARIEFELFRIAMQQNSHGMLSVTQSVLTPGSIEPKPGTPRIGLRSPELEGLEEALALHQFAQSRISDGHAVNETASQQPSSVPPGKNAPATSKTPIQTPRPEDGDASKSNALPTIREMLESAGFEASKALKLLETRFHSDKRTVEVVCKVASAAMSTVSTDDIEHLLSTVKITGDFSRDFRALLIATGGASLLPDEVSPPPDLPAQVSLGSARALSEADKAESKANVDQLTSEAIAPSAPDDMYLYHWCGEVFFLKAIITSRKIMELRSRMPHIDVDHGPMTEDNVFSVLQGETTGDDTLQTSPTDAQDSHGKATSETDAPVSDHDATTPREPSDQSRFDALLEQLLEQVSACCQLYYRGQCWQNLQAATQCLWNLILGVWIPPSLFAGSELRLRRLESCVNALLDMVELSTAPSGFESLHAKTVPSGQVVDDQALASTTVVKSAMGKLRVKDVWLVEFVTYTTQSFACARSWERIVRMGERYYNCCGLTKEGTRFAELNFPVVLHAQTQILKREDEALAAAQAERQAIVVAFQDQEAKRKKKKSRLVVEEVATPEELAFRARDTEMKELIQRLTKTRDLERTKLQHLSSVHDGLQKSRNKSQQALDHCHELVNDFRRCAKQQTTVKSASSSGVLATLRRRTISAFTRCITNCRQKRQKLLACQALQELGDFYYACGDEQAAAKNWYEALDNAFSTLRVIDTWRQVVSTDFDDDTGINGDAEVGKIAGDELWIALQSCGALGKLIFQTGRIDAHRAVECALLAAAIFTRLYACAMPHPTKLFLFGSYSVVGQLWPGRDVLLDSESVSAFQVTSALLSSLETLLQYEADHAVVAMPVVVGYEYLAASCLNDKAHVANALRLRVTALTYAGRFQEAIALLPTLFSGCTTFADNAPVFRANKQLQDPANAAALSWFTTVSVANLAADLKTRCHFRGPLIRQILLALLRLAGAIAGLNVHGDSQLLAMRGSVQNMAEDVLELLAVKRGCERSSEQADEEQEGAAQANQEDAWDAYELSQLRCDVMLHQGRLLFVSGQWTAAVELAERAVDALATADAHQKQSNPSEPTASASVDHELKYSPASQHATLMAKCRRLAVTCHIARGDMHAALALAIASIREAQEAGEKLLCHELELQRAQVLACLGRRAEAADALARLSLRMVEQHAASRSALYVRVLHNLGAIARANAAFSADPELLSVACGHLAAAKRQLDRVLRAEGWVGVPGSEQSSPDVADTSTRNKFLNLYYPALPLFVQVSADLAQAVAECPAGIDASQGGHDISGSLSRGEQVLTLVHNALLVLDELSGPRHISATKAQLLLLQGATLKKKLFAQLPASSASDETTEALHKAFAECVSVLQCSIRVCISEGGHDRALIRRALVELIELYVSGCFPSDKDAHVHAAFHYLGLAVRVCRQESTLFDSVELQLAAEPMNAVNLATEQQLPAYIIDAIGRVSAAAPLDNANGAPSHTPTVNAPAPAADVSKKASAGSNAAPGARAASLPFEPAHAINYFVRTLREQNVAPAGNSVLQETALRLHYFLAQAHPAYAKHCCLAELPPVPPLAPEISPGLVCAHWGQDLTPGVSFTPSSVSERAHVTLFFTLGTTKMDLSDGVDDADAAFQRMERFVTTPLLSKRGGVSVVAIRQVGAAMSRLRVDMEDEQSLVIDRDAFPTRLRSVLRRFQLIFRKPNLPRGTDEGSGLSADDELRDVFGNAIHLPPTLEVVRMLEALLTVSSAVSAADNALCYFLRDLLE